MKKIQIFLFLLISCLLVGCNKQRNDYELDFNKAIPYTDPLIVNLIRDFKGINHVYNMDLGEKLGYIRNNNLSLYNIKISNEYKIVCAYISESIYIDESIKIHDSQYFKEAYWFYWDDNKNIPRKIGRFKLASVYIAYDAIVVEDVLKDETHNLNIKLIKEVILSGDDFYHLRECDFIQEKEYLLYLNKDFLFNNRLVLYHSLKNGHAIRTNENEISNVLIGGYIYGTDDDIIECELWPLSPYEKKFMCHLLLNDEFELCYDVIFSKEYNIKYYTIEKNCFISIIKEILDEE